MLIDVVNEQNQKIGTIDKDRVLSARKNFRTVHGWLRTQSGDVLLQRLSSSHPRSSSKLGSTVAGYLRAGESYEDGFQRKCEVEIGSKPGAVSFLGIAGMTDRKSEKFIGLFSGTVLEPPYTNDPKIAHFETYRRAQLEAKIRSNPESFTETFMFLYRNFWGKLNAEESNAR